MDLQQQPLNQISFMKLSIKTDYLLHMVMVILLQLKDNYHTRHSPLFRNKRFMLDEMTKRNASEFAIFLEYENRKSFFSLCATCFIDILVFLLVI